MTCPNNSGVKLVISKKLLENLLSNTIECLAMRMNIMNPDALEKKLIEKLYTDDIEECKKILGKGKEVKQ